MLKRLSRSFHQNRIAELCSRCHDGLILLRGELDWFRKRELRLFDPAYGEPNFKQEKNLYYLTGIEVPNSFVMIDPRDGRAHLYTDWDGPREIERAKTLGVVDEMHASTPLLRDLRIKSAAYECIYTLYSPFPEAGSLVAKTGPMTGIFPPGMAEPLGDDLQFARQLTALFPGVRVKSLHPILQEMQKIKLPEEIELLRRANEIAVSGIIAAMKAIRPGLYDHHVAAVIDYALLHEGASRLAFPANIMSGPNAFTKLLHLWSDYTHRNRRLEAEDAVFIDVGAEFQYYQSDIGRTVPGSGKFNTRQKEIYELYLRCYSATLESVAPGVTQRDLLNKCVATMQEQSRHLKADYLRKAAEQFVQITSARPMLGHYVDMNVIGAGAGVDEPLQPGMVFVIEPLLFSEETGFAVFMEDTILVTEDGYELLSKGLPNSADEIELVMSEPAFLEAPVAEAGLRSAPR
ncbi:MAG: aminopeptidase P family protein [Acidobacteria bacterium]|nr:aminopeptidase P family protein [Acidobacteriota bacterium]